MNLNISPFNITIGVINDNHIEIVKIINRLCQAIHENLPKTNLLNILDELETYAIAHFETEEKYYKRLNYPKSEIHRLKDSLLLEKIEECRINFENKHLSQEDLLNFLFNWLLAHLKDHDIKFEKFIEENNLHYIYNSQKKVDFDF